LRLLFQSLFAVSLFIFEPCFALKNPSCDVRVLRHSTAPTKGHVLISDAVSSGSLIPEALRQRGYTPVHVLSTPEMDRDIAESIDMSDFDEDKRFVYHGDLERLVRETEHLHLAAVLPGGETGVNLADEFAERLGLVGNGTALTHERRDKFLQIEACARAGIPVARQALVSTLYDLFAHAPRLGLPLVLKPRDAAAGFQVAIERDPWAIAQAFYSTLASTNPLTGKLITDVLLQEYLDGKDEYVVDMAIHEGNVYVTDVTLYNKVAFNGAPVVYESEDLLPLDYAEKLGLIDYAKRVVAAVGIRNGGAHMEIKMTSKGPRLVEVGARMAGGGFPVMVQRATGEYPVDAVLDAYLDPAAFYARLKRPRKTLPGKVVYLMNSKTGRLIDMPYLKQIESLDSWFRTKLNLNIHDPIGPTTNFFNYPGQFELVHEDPAVVERDYQTIRSLEKHDDFYVVEALAP
jgi:biotin carboxylase